MQNIEEIRKCNGSMAKGEESEEKLRRRKYRKWQ
jgi:hypothetical protein